SLHGRVHTALLDLDVEHLAAPRVRAAARQASAEPEPLQDADPALRPPALSEGAPLRMGLDAAPRFLGARGFAVAVAPPGPIAVVRHRYSATALARRVMSSRSCELESAVSQASLVPTTCSAIPFFFSIISSIFSSRVP